MNQPIISLHKSNAEVVTKLVNDKYELIKENDTIKAEIADLRAELSALKAERAELQKELEAEQQLRHVIEQNHSLCEEVIGMYRGELEQAEAVMRRIRMQYELEGCSYDPSKTYDAIDVYFTAKEGK